MNEAEARATASPTRYRAFISYCHADGRLAGWLHHKLEGWKLADGSRLAPIFIDRAELAAGPDLSASVREAVADSAALIVIASPAARASHWVAQEIALFRAAHPGRPVLAALIAGEPGEAFPEALLSHEGAAIEPLAADFRTGRDGKRLALLKIVAGLTRQPLDRLVQRDAQSRQRRVVWITAGALLLSLILAALLVAALRARSEAQRQRAEAEGMVEFMLTDLRDKLKGVGRLDVMDAVNERAMAHYAQMGNIDGLPFDMMLRRARLLQAMAEDDLSAVGKFDRGVAEANMAATISGGLLKRQPANPDAMLAHAMSEYWVGEADFQNSKLTASQRRGAAMPHWQEYRRLTSELVSRDPDNTTWLTEASYAEGNLCALGLSAPARPLEALTYCDAASRRLESAHKLKPADLEIGLNLATAYAWQADAYAGAGRPASALQFRARQDDLVRALEDGFPSDGRVAEARLLADFGKAKLLTQIGRTADARPVLQRAEQRARALQGRDPGNGAWATWLKQISTLAYKINH